MKSSKSAAGTSTKNGVAAFEGLKSLPVSVAIVDTAGTIVAVNKSWKLFGRRNGLRLSSSAVGLNYLHYCLTNEPNSRRFAAQLKALLAGRRDLLTFVYPCHSPMRTRWFCLIGVPLSRSKSGGVALLHVNITKLLPIHTGTSMARAEGQKDQIRRQAGAYPIGAILERSVLEPLSSQLNSMFTGLVFAQNGGSDPINAARTRLSKRQMEVLELLGQGKTNKEIAMALVRSPNTIKLHVSAILQRLQLKSRTEAALLSSKLLQDDPAAGVRLRKSLRD